MSTPYANIFSHPAFIIPSTASYTLVGYNLIKSAATGGGQDTGTPNYYGPWTAVTGYSNYTNNRDIVDIGGTPMDLYRVQPIVLATPLGGSPTQVLLPFSRPFRATQPLYDMQISVLLENFRKNYLQDVPIRHTDSTLPTESTGGAVMPFITDSTTSRFYMSFLQNDDPVKVIPEDTVVWLGSSQAAAMTAPKIQYTDFYASADGGFVDFKVTPPTSSYMRIDYRTVRNTDDDCRNSLLNAVSQLSLYGINSFQVNNSNNLSYLSAPLPNNDLAEIVQMIAYKNLMNAHIGEASEASEGWKDGKVEWTADPSRALQAETMHVSNLSEELRHRCNAYIINTRNYLGRGEFDSYFDVSGVLPIYSLMVAGFNVGGAMGWWL